MRWPWRRHRSSGDVVLDDALANSMGKLLQQCIRFLPRQQACRVLIKGVAAFHSIFGTRDTLILLYELTEAVTTTPVLTDKGRAVVLTEMRGEH
jgi:hypothetical protein